MENKIFEFLDECQSHLGQFSDISQIEEVVSQLINIVYFLLEKTEQLKEECNLKIENIQNELTQLQELYNNANKEIEELSVQYKKQIEICQQFEEKLDLKEIELKQELEKEQQLMVSDNIEMVRSLQQQTQYIDTIIQRNENQQIEIKGLMLKIEKLQLNKKQSSLSAISPQIVQLSNLINSENQTPLLKQYSGQDSQVSLQPLGEEGTNKLPRTPHHVKVHSKNQSFNWCQLATITQTLRSVCQSQATSQGNIEKKNLKEELKNEEINQKIEMKKLNISSFAQQQQIIKQENPYFDFFILISQSVKLDLNKTAYYSIHVDDLFDKFINEAIPFNKWYQEIKQYILNYKNEEF